MEEALLQTSSGVRSSWATSVWGCSTITSARSVGLPWLDGTTSITTGAHCHPLLPAGDGATRRSASAAQLETRRQLTPVNGEVEPAVHQQVLCDEKHVPASDVTVWPLTKLSVSVRWLLHHHKMKNVLRVMMQHKTRWSLLITPGSVASPESHQRNIITTLDQSSTELPQHTAYTQWTGACFCSVLQ